MYEFESPWPHGPSEKLHNVTDLSLVGREKTTNTSDQYKDCILNVSHKKRFICVSFNLKTLALIISEQTNLKQLVQNLKEV